MAEINVEKKSSFPWWIWIIVGLIVVGILFFLLGGDNTTGTDTRDRDRDTRDTRDTVRRQGTTDLTPASEEMNFDALKAVQPSLAAMPINALT